MLKYYRNIIFILSFRHIHVVFVSLFLLMSCATKNTQFGSKATSINSYSDDDSVEIIHQLFLTGNVYDTSIELDHLQDLKERISKTNTPSHLVFLGNTLKPNEEKKRVFYSFKQEEFLTKNLNFWEDYKGDIIYTPGENEWKNEGLKGLLSWQNNLIEKQSRPIKISPSNGCGFESYLIHDQILFISLDSQWYLEDWNLHPQINQYCQYKTRKNVTDEIKSLLNENQEKTIIFSTHHPIFNNGYHGGQFDIKTHFFPFGKQIFLPIVGSLYNITKKAGGWDAQDIQNSRYQNLFDELKNILKKHKNVVVVSGLEGNLQYIHQENIHQIISGSGNKSTSARAINSKDFSFGNHGYAELSIYKNQSVYVTFYATKNQKEVVLFRKKILEGKKLNPLNFQNQKYPNSTLVSIYDKSKTRKTDTYHFLWGKHYADLYQKEFYAKTAWLDTLYGGLKPVGLEQYSTSQFLTLKDKKGNEYWLTPIKKDVQDFLQSHSFQTQDENEPFQKTITQDFLEDYFTTIYPFATLGISQLSKAIGVNTLDPKLYYIPKTNQFYPYQDKMGNALYIITKKPSISKNNSSEDENLNPIISTNNLLRILKTEKNQQIEVNAYLKARLFDMLIGDWDRNADHYRWEAKKVEDNTIYTPIPFHRDQAFAKYDGVFLSLLKKIPALGQMHHYGKKIKNLNRFNSKVYTLDLALLSEVKEKEWIDAAIYIQSHLTDQIIEQAFDAMSLNNENKHSELLKEKFKKRLENLKKTAKKYHHLLEEKVLVVGTHLNDTILISRLEKNRTQITVYQGKIIPQNMIFDKTFSKKDTKEIWIYGLEGQDYFHAEGRKKLHSKLKIIGGQGHDSYQIDAGKKITIFDYFENTNQIVVSKNSKIYLNNDYEINGYNYDKPSSDQLGASPLIGINPDDGLRLGAKIEFLKRGFKSKPYTQKHVFSSNYYFATQGNEFSYQSTLKNIYTHWDFILDAGVTSSNFAMNFFGYGNETRNLDEAFGFNYNRVKIGKLKIHPGFELNQNNGNSISILAQIDRFEVERTPGRFVSLLNENTVTFDRQTWGGLQIKYVFENYNHLFTPTLGMKFYSLFSWITKMEQPNQHLPSFVSGLHLTYKLVPNATVVFKTKIETKALLSNNFEFYQGATIGGDFSLRGFRAERFNGKQSFFQSSDIKFNVGTIKNPFVPVKYGCLIGFDYGRVWFPSEISSIWHNSLGGGVWFMNSKIFTSHISYFNSSDGGRLTFGIDFNF